MNILIVGHRFLVAELQKSGHRVLSLGSMGSGHDIAWNRPLSVDQLNRLLADRSFEPQVLFCCDDGNIPILYGQETLPCLSVFYSIDTFCNPWHIPQAYAYDYVLAAQKDHARMFSDEGHATQWFPLFCQHVEPEQSPDEWLAARDIPTSFVGSLKPRNIPDRLPFLINFNKLSSLRFEEGEYTSVYKRSRIVLNQSAASELNFRLYEAAACGAAVLNDTEEHGFTELFTIGADILPTYPRLDAARAVAVANFWLARPRELARIAAGGRNRVAKEHSAEARARTLIHLCEKLLQDKAMSVRFADLQRRRHLISTAYAILADELPPTLATHKRFYNSLAAGYHAA